MTNETRRIRQDRKRAEAEERQARHDALTPAQKLAKAMKGGGTNSREYKRLKAAEAV